MRAIGIKNQESRLLDPEMGTCKTHVLKITNLPIFHMALGLDAFDRGKSITRAIGRGVPKNIFVMDVPALKSLRPPPTTGTLIVNSSSTSCVYFYRPTAEGVCSERRYCLISV
jgi:hypothetical protein